MDQPKAGGRFVRDPETGALAKVSEAVTPPEPEAAALTETPAPAVKASTPRKAVR
ncbi:hypothetical protein [Rhizobium sp. Root708]|uniref:hypothetical protein n=1 Tax=Rhizobium sp. Root708 TaxID=1736592 RepID=UPI000A96D6D8|nr:hypothetical protein [Rhizobium sp. Root708]